MILIAKIVNNKIGYKLFCIKFHHKKHPTAVVSVGCFLLRARVSGGWNDWFHTEKL